MVENTLEIEFYKQRPSDGGNAKRHVVLPHYNPGVIFILDI